jgi:tRNA threonylcarbamoyladenosine biosynthesis protein TsaE
MSVDLNLSDAKATEALGAALAAGAVPGRVLHLRGELGSGKTTVVRGALRALGFEGRVKSPTYAVVEPYTVSRLNLYHFDFYRLKEPSEWLSSGFREYFSAQSVCFVEWPERAGDTLPPPDLELKLEFAHAGRRARLTAHSSAGEAWLASASLSSS